MPTKPIPPLLTLRSLAEYFDTEPHRIHYAIRTRDIKPKIVAGKTRIFDFADLGRIERALDEAANYNASERAEGEAPRV